jgi:chemotaxis protein MotB
MDATKRPIIIKRIKKADHGGHHGGAWKVAFADFVTAMMAFFLLLWLLNVTDEEQRAGISDYFQAPAGRIEGLGVSDATVVEGGALNQSTGEGAEDFGHSETEPPPVADPPADDALPTAAAAEGVLLKQLKSELIGIIQSSKALEPYKDQLLVDVTVEGLRIQIVDKDKRKMFATGSASLEEHTRKILRVLGKTINGVPNRISLSGHTDASRFAWPADTYSNWELSADRANASRRELIAGGFAEDKVARVVGLGSVVPFDEENPRDPINRRISIVVLNQSAERALRAGSAPVRTAAEATEIFRTEILQPH